MIFSKTTELEIYPDCLETDYIHQITCTLFVTFHECMAGNAVCPSDHTYMNVKPPNPYVLRYMRQSIITYLYISSIMAERVGFGTPCLL